MKRLRVLVLMHGDLVPPDPLSGERPEMAEWKTEYDVVTTLRKLGHDVKPLGVKSDLGVIRAAVEEWRPHIAVNLFEEVGGVGGYDPNVVFYLELLWGATTRCDPPGPIVARGQMRCK